jgi:DNA-binding NtrC family response regulator
MTIPHNIIVVDPEDTIRALLDEYFSSQGYRVFGVATLSDGCRLVADDKSRIILLDSGLSPKDTVDSIDRLNRIRSDLRIIVITGYPTLDGVIEALRHGVFDVVIKPFRLADLNETVKRAMLSSEQDQVDDTLRDRISTLEKLLVENGISLPDAEKEASLNPDRVLNYASATGSSVQKVPAGKENDIKNE